MDKASTTTSAAVPEMGRPGEEKEESWIPLIQEELPRSSQLQQQIAAPNVSTSPLTLPRRCESLEATQKRVDTRIRLKRGLVDHPLNQGWRLFAKHFASEIWQLDVHLRLGIVLVVIGTLLQMLMWALSFRWYHPRTIILFLVFAVSFVYLAPKDVEKQIQAFFRLLTTPNKVFDVADYVDPTTMRMIFLALLMIPTLLEARTFGFLSEIMAESGFANNVSVGFLLTAFLTYRLKKQKSTPRDCIQRGIHVLYGFAFLVSILRVDLGRLPGLMGPFFFATGTLLLSYRDDDMNWLSRAVRHALRLTLRDVLASVSETVAEDEMLQLAMLRWIVDYWSYQPSETPAPVPNRATSDAESRPTPSSFPVRTTQSQPIPHQELQWEELRPMLDMTTDQMIEEVPTHTPDYTRRQSESRPPWTDSSAQTEDNGSLHNLKSMLAALDVDDRAKPAVMAYKQAVAAFPPTRRQALWFSVVRRCPAMLMLLYRYMIASDLAFASTVTLLPFAIMEAMRVLHWAEACQRALEGGAQNPENEQLLAGRSIASSISIPVCMDPMCILLSGDFYTPSHPPSLLQVWVNICSSVAALEMGLTAARCAQTTAVAADFAGNIISLAQFGVEVSQHGWVHGLTVMVQELVHLHATQSTGRNTKYASAAINAVRNGSIVARNVRALAEEDSVNPVIEPLLGVLLTIVGHGWLWGRENNEESTVTIEEISVDEKQSECEDNRELSIKLEETSINEIPSAQDAEAAVSGDGAQTDEPASVAPEADSKSHPPPTNEENSTEDLSELMQLIADAFEQGLVLEAEKNAFVETILEAGSGKHRGPNRTAVEQMERSLRGLLESAEIETLPCSAAQAKNESCQSPSQGDLEEGTSVGPSVDSSAGEITNDHFAPKQVLEEPTESPTDWRVLGKLPSSVKNSDADDCSRNVPLSFGASANSSIDVSSDQPPCFPDENLGASPSVDESNARQDKKGDEWVKWIGGSLAVLGAVAGGIAIANASQGEDDGRPRSNDRTGHSVYIEELDDDDENTDEWVSVSAASSHD